MGKKMYEPSPERVAKTHMYCFMHYVNDRFGQNFQSYPELYAWSVAQIADFWGAFWDFAEIIHSVPYEQVVDDPGKMPGATWFSGARLNFAENLLRYRDNRTALIFQSEDGPPRTLSYAELYSQVAAVAQSLKELGIRPGDRVAGFMPNMPETIIAMLAAASLGAVWSSCSPDFGIKGVLDRFGQIRPRVLFTANGYFFKGREIDSLERISSVLQHIDSVEQVVVVPLTRVEPDLSGIPQGVMFEDFKSDEPDLKIEFEQLPFDHPLYIMYSSGTTGLPKCMVQSAGGILLHQVKEHMLHTDVSRKDTVFYFTTCGWMMWNWLVSGLALGPRLVLYDGNPFHPDPGVLWRAAQDQGITVFGTSAGYLAALEASGIKPGRDYDLSPLRTVLSTGSPLSEAGFEFVYRDIKSDLQLASIAGGTDLNGCFALGNPMGPVYAGELQCRGLGMKVFAYDDAGRPVSNQQGELVCTAPFPSMPIYFWDDPDGQKYHQAYFDVYPGIWRHGDFVEITERGGVVFYGRSDATLNPGGVRIGTAEIYRQVEQIEEIEDSLVIGQQWNNDVRVILFVKLFQGVELTDALKKKIVNTIRSNASPRHVPAKIVEVPDIPYTLNMKKVELAVKKIIHGKSVSNKDALKNPECLDFYEAIPELRQD